MKFYLKKEIVLYKMCLECIYNFFFGEKMSKEDEDFLIVEDSVSKNKKVIKQPLYKFQFISF